MEDQISQPSPQVNAQAALPPAYAESALERIRGAVRGNGIKSEEVTIKTIEGQTADIEVDISLILRTRTMERIIGGKKTGGEKVENPQGVRDAVEKERFRILSSTDTISKIQNIVMERKDKGFGMRNEVIKLPFLTKEYVYHQACRTCNAQGEIKCQRCNGKGFETCPKCNGQSMEICTQCRGAQLIFNGNNKVPCPKCNGQGRTPCMMCNQTRKIACTTCRTKGSTPCQNCNGQAWHSYITMAEVDVVGTFNFQREQLPPRLAGAIETRVKEIPTYAELAIVPMQTQAQMHGEQKSDEIPLRYHLRLPYADVEFNLGKNNNVRASLLGLQAEIIDMPSFLENLIRPGMNALHDAAAGRGNVAAKIMRAGKYRTVRQAVVAASKYSKGKAAKLLAKNTPLGLNPVTIKTLIIDADEALKKITAKPRRNGVIFGTLLAAMFYTAYLTTGLRAMILGTHNAMPFDVVTDGAVLGAGMMGAVVSIQLLGAGAIKKALSKLLPPDQKDKIISKAGHSGLWSALLCVVFFLTAAEASVHMSTPPDWYMMARAVIVH